MANVTKSGFSSAGSAGADTEADARGSGEEAARSPRPGEATSALMKIWRELTSTGFWP